MLICNINTRKGIVTKTKTLGKVCSISSKRSVYKQREVSDLLGTVLVVELDHSRTWGPGRCSGVPAESPQQVDSALASVFNPLPFLSSQHVHVHVLPRKVGDFERNDSVYDEVSVRIFDWLFRRQTGGATHTGHTWT